MVWLLILGLIVGAIAKLIMPGKDPGGFIVTMLLGLCGSFMANMVGTEFGWFRISDGASVIASVIGALCLLIIYRIFDTKRHTPLQR